jgi:hypothetical protein
VNPEINDLEFEMYERNGCGYLSETYSDDNYGDGGVKKLNIFNKKGGDDDSSRRSYVSYGQLIDDMQNRDQTEDFGYINKIDEGSVESEESVNIDRLKELFGENEVVQYWLYVRRLKCLYMMYRNIQRCKVIVLPVDDDDVSFQNVEEAEAPLREEYDVSSEQY